jgi:hypothetical protein
MPVPLSLVFLAALTASPSSHAARPLEDDPYRRALRLAPLVLKESCPPYLMRTPAASFVEAPIACDAFLASALVSLSLDDPERTAEALPILDRLIEHGLGARARKAFASTGSSTVASLELPRSILYRGFVLLMLAGRERLQPGTGPRTELFDALAEDVAAALEQSRIGYLPSFGTKMIWPCDHAPAASGLVLHGALRGGERSRRAGEALVRRLLGDLGRKGGFPTRVLPSGKLIEPTPRGTTHAWTAAFLGLGVPEAGRAFSRELLRKFCDRKAAFTACREWPRGVDRPGDGASGPLISGYGIGPSALAVGAAQFHPAGDWDEALLRTASRYQLDRVLDPLPQMKLENAIFLWGLTVRPWANAS